MTRINFTQKFWQDLAKAGAQGLIEMGINEITSGRNHDYAMREMDHQAWLNEKAAVAANDRQKDLWDYQAEYNNAENQRKRLEEAGLSPALMYSGGLGSAGGYGGTVNVAQGGASGASGNRMQAPTIDPLTASQIELNESTARKNDSEAKHEDAQTAWQEVKTEIEKQNKEIGERLKDFAVASGKIKAYEDFYNLFGKIVELYDPGDVDEWKLEWGLIEGNAEFHAETGSKNINYKKTAIQIAEAAANIKVSDKIIEKYDEEIKTQGALQNLYHATAALKDEETRWYAIGMMIKQAEATAKAMEAAAAKENAEAHKVEAEAKWNEAKERAKTLAWERGDEVNWKTYYDGGMELLKIAGNIVGMIFGAKIMKKGTTPKGEPKQRENGGK